MGIDEMGTGQTESSPTGSDQGTDEATVEQRDRLLEAAEVLRDSLEGQVAVSASRLVNPLLDLWAMAVEVGPDASAPVEQLLTVYAGPRELASASELDELVETLRRVTGSALV